MPRRVHSMSMECPHSPGTWPTRAGPSRRRAGSPRTSPTARSRSIPQPAASSARAVPSSFAPRPPRTATSVSISNADVNGNVATDSGGGIFVSAVESGTGTELSVSSTTIQNNVVTSGTGKGGGLFFASGTLGLFGVTFSDNTAFDGNGFYLSPARRWMKTRSITSTTGTPGIQVPTDRVADLASRDW